MSAKGRRSQRQQIEVAELKGEASSFLSWGIEDDTLRKLETYRLYQAGYAVADIAEAFGFSQGYLYEMWGSKIASRSKSTRRVPMPCPAN